MSSEVIDFDTNRKRVCDFLLVRHSTLVLSCTVSESIFVLLIPPLFRPNFVVFPMHQIAHVGVSQSINLKLISREIIFEVGYSNLCEKHT